MCEQFQISDRYKQQLSSSFRSANLLAVLISICYRTWNCRDYCILSSIVRTFFTENDAEILTAHYTWKVAYTNLIRKQSIQVKFLNGGALYTRMHTILDKIQFILHNLSNTLFSHILSYFVAKEFKLLWVGLNDPRNTER